MNTKLLKKIREKEEKLLDIIYEIQEVLDLTEDEELSYMGSEFCEVMVNHINDNDTMTLEKIKTFIEENE